MTTDTGNGTGPRTGPPSWPWVARPAGWFLTPQESGQEDQPEPMDPDEPGPAPSGQVAGEWFVAGQDGPQNYWYEDDAQEEPADPHVVGPTAAMNGLPGGPGFAVPPGAVAGVTDERSPWEQSEGVWRGSGIVWEHHEDAEGNVAGPVGGGAAFSVPPAFGGGQHRGPGGPADDPMEDPAWDAPGRGFSQPNVTLSAPTLADMPALPRNTAPPTRAEAAYGQAPPTRAEAVYAGGADSDDWTDEPDPTRRDGWTGQAGWTGQDGWTGQPGPTRQGGWQPRQTARVYGDAWASGPGTDAEAGERDQVFQVWRDQQMNYPDLPRVNVRRGPRRRPVAKTAFKVGIPVVVIAAVGAGAVMMLTGKTKVVVTPSSDTTTPRQAATGTTGNANAPATNTNTPAMTAFAAVLPGYSGRGTSGELVEGLAAANGTQLAVGTVGGLPAVWRRGANGSWSLVTQNTVGITGRAAVLTKIVRGPAGWVAIGVVGSNAAPHPVVLVSANGQTWQFVDGEQAFGKPGASVSGVTASRDGYLVVGKIVHGGRTIAATWWSTDLYHWVRDGNNGGLDGRLQPSLLTGATAAARGFVAVGQHGRLPAVWLSGAARSWTVTDLPMPAGATSASLTRVATSGNRIVALGDAVTAGGTVPFAEVSGDGGVNWREVPIVTPGGKPATVTALTVTASGFIAAAQAGGTDAIYWSSADGTAWSAPRQAGSGIAAITGLIPSGGTVTGIGESPAGHPVIWAASR